MTAGTKIMAGIMQTEIKIPAEIIIEIKADKPDYSYCQVNASNAVSKGSAIGRIFAPTALCQHHYFNGYLSYNELRRFYD
jgi:hypothetical protein